MCKMCKASAKHAKNRVSEASYDFTCWRCWRHGSHLHFMFSGSSGSSGTSFPFQRQEVVVGARHHRDLPSSCRARWARRRQRRRQRRRRDRLRRVVRVVDTAAALLRQIQQGAEVHVHVRVLLGMTHTASGTSRLRR